MGLESNVNAVRPSNSSAMPVLAVHSASRTASTMINVSPVSSTILMSSPKV